MTFVMHCWSAQNCFFARRVVLDEAIKRSFLVHVPEAFRILARPLVLICFLITISCAPPEDDFSKADANRKKDRLARMKPSEVKAVAPTPLFVSVYEGDLSGVQKTFKSKPAQAHVVNADKDTAFGVALKLKEEAIAKYFAENWPLETFSYQNEAGETYVFLASKMGQTAVLQRLADRQYASISGINDYGFADLDLPTKEGQRAIHVAQTEAVLEILDREYHRGFMEVSYGDFTLHLDNRSRTFFHTAAEDNRDSAIEWGVKKFCWISEVEGWQGGVWAIPRNLVYIPGVVLRYLNTQFGDFGLFWDYAINRRDENNASALHRAAQLRNEAAVRALANCRILDYYSEDENGDLALHTFLKSLDPHRKSLQDAYSLFDFLHLKKTEVRFRLQLSDYINHQNHEGDTAAHLAARLNDPYFFEALKAYADLYLKNNKGETPLGIRSTQDSKPDSSPQSEPKENRIAPHSKPEAKAYLFDEPLRGTDSREHYLIEGERISPEGSIKLHSHFNGFEFRDGVQISLNFSGNRVLATVSSPGEVLRPLGEMPLDDEAHGHFRFRIEVHDGGKNYLSVFVWNDYVMNRKGELSPKGKLSDQNADLSSQQQGLSFSQNGRGARWGLEIEGVRLKRVTREAPWISKS